MFRRPTHPPPAHPLPADSNDASNSPKKARKSVDTSPATLSISSFLDASPERRRHHLPHVADMLHYIPPKAQAIPVASNGGWDEMRGSETSPELGVSIAAPTNRSSAGNSDDIYRTSPGSSPRNSMLSQKSSMGSPPLSTSPRLSGERERKRISPRAKNGSSSARLKSPDDAERRRRTASQRDGKKISPLVKRLGEEAPFVLPHPSRSDATSQQYPGVIIGSFAGGARDDSLGFGLGEMRFDGSMNDILDLSAAPQLQARHDSTSGAAGANIAPWLMDDTPSKPQLQPWPSPQFMGEEQAWQGQTKDVPRKASVQTLSHFASVPALPRVKAHGTIAFLSEMPSGSSSRSGSEPSRVPAAAHGASSSRTRDGTWSRTGSDESVQTLGAPHQKSGSSPSGEPARLPPQTSKQPGVASGSRTSRFGSTAANISGGSGGAAEKKKGFLGSLLKRKATANTFPSEWIKFI